MMMEQPNAIIGRAMLSAHGDSGVARGLRYLGANSRIVIERSPGEVWAKTSR
jgi:hypothetical protein